MKINTLIILENHFHIEKNLFILIIFFQNCKFITTFYIFVLISYVFKINNLFFHLYFFLIIICFFNYYNNF